MNYAYIRFSTDKQDETQQVQALTEYAERQGVTIDAVEKDEGVSGGVSFRDRNLSGLVKKLKRGDALIVSEISRLGRSMSDLNILVNEELKPRGVRLIVVKMGIDLDCANIRAVDQMLLYSFSFAAQLEKELIQSRTQSALDARKKLIEEDGGFVSKAGNFCTHLGSKKGADMSAPARASAEKSKNAKDEWRKTGLFAWVELQLRKGRPRREIVAEARQMYEKDPERWCTRQGKPLSEAHLSLWAKDILPVI
jgi:DNA invertase Pin-like site-specific DNA recombinase